MGRRQGFTRHVMQVLPDLPNNAGKGGSEQLLQTGRPGVIPAVHLQVVDPLEKNNTLVTISEMCTNDNKTLHYFKKNFTGKDHLQKYKDQVEK